MIYVSQSIRVSYKAVVKVLSVAGVTSRPMGEGFASELIHVVGHWQDSSSHPWNGSKRGKCLQSMPAERQKRLSLEVAVTGLYDTVSWWHPHHWPLFLFIKGKILGSSLHSTKMGLHTGMNIRRQTSLGVMSEAAYPPQIIWVQYQNSHLNILY